MGPEPEALVSCSSGTSLIVPELSGGGMHSDLPEDSEILCTSSEWDLEHLRALDISIEVLNPSSHKLEPRVESLFRRSNLMPLLVLDGREEVWAC